MIQLELGKVETLLDAHASSTGNSDEYALPTRATQLTWQTSFGTGPASITLQLQTSLDDSVWSTIDTSTSTAGESKTINTSATFVRVRINAVSGGTAITVKLIAKAVSIINIDNPTFNDVIINNDLTVSGSVHIANAAGAHAVLWDSGSEQKWEQNPWIEGVTVGSGNTDYVNIATDGSGGLRLINNDGVELVYPKVDGTNGQFLKTNGAGILSFATVAGLPVSTGADKILYDNGVTQDWSASPHVISISLVELDGNPSIDVYPDSVGYFNINCGVDSINFQSSLTGIVLGNTAASINDAAIPITIATRPVIGNDNSADISITGGSAVDGNAGNINLTAGTASGSGSPGQININSVSYFASYQVRIKASDSLGTGSSLQLLAGGTLTSSGENGGDVTVEAGYGLGSSTGGNINLTAGGSDTGSPGRINVSGNIFCNGTIAAGEFILTESRLKSDTFDEHAGGLAVYDVDAAAYRDFLTWTNGNTPAVVMNPPTGGTLSVDANAFKSSGVAGVDASIIIPLVGTITVSKGIITGFA